MDPMVAWTTFGLYKSTVSFEHTISVTPNQSHNHCPQVAWVANGLKQQSNQTHRFSSQVDFKTAKQVFGVASALIFFKSNSFIKDFFVDTAWKSFWVEYKCSNSKFESVIPVLLLRLRQKNNLMVLYFFLL
jgi:hypothetical protein